MRLLFPFPPLATWDKAIALQSAQVLRNLDPMRLAVGHGDALENPVEAMDAAIIAAQEHSHGTKAITQL